MFWNQEDVGWFGWSQLSSFSSSHRLVWTCSTLNSWLKDPSLYVYSWSQVTAAKSLQSCPTLCDPIDCSPPGSPVPGILQARTLDWVAISFSNAWKWKVKVKSFSRVRLFVTPWTAPYQAPLSTGFSRQEYWSGVPSPSPWSQVEGAVTAKQRTSHDAKCTRGQEETLNTF